MRHGAAEPGNSGRPDHERQLTDAGRQSVAAVLSAVAHTMKPGILLASPYKRAQQTAAIAIEKLGLRVGPVESSCLTPDSTPQDAWNDIRIQAGNRAVLAVLHQPLIGALSAFLLNCPGLAIEFDTATVIAIETTNNGPQPRGVLRWMAGGSLLSRAN